MIDRATIISHSTELYARNQLFVVRNYPTAKVEFLDSYPSPDRMTKALTKNYIAVGYQTDDGGKQAELGSSLKVRKYTIDFYVFGITRVWAKNLASVLRFSLEADQVIDLIDPNDGTTVLGHVDVDFVSAQEAVTRTPRPWEENAWITRLRVIDYYSSADGN
jgi:hypothetical protein